MAAKKKKSAKTINGIENTEFKGLFDVVDFAKIDYFLKDKVNLIFTILVIVF